MFANIIVILLTLAFGFFYKIQKTSDQIDSNINRFKFVVLISFILILQSALRNIAVGIDTYMYSLMFDEVKSTSWSQIIDDFILYITTGEGKDVGYPLLVKTFQIFSNSFRTYLFFIAILFFGFLGRFLYLNTNRLNDLILAFVLYSVMFYSFYSITGLRQTIAMSICIFSIEFIKKRNFLKFILCIISVVTIHKSVVFFIPVYFIYNFKFTKLLYFSSLILFPIIFALKNEIAFFLIKFSGSKYDTYKNFEGETGTYVFTFFLLILGLVIILFLKKILITSPNSKMYLNIFSVAVILTPLTYVNPSLMRIVMYYSFFLIIIIPFIIESFSIINIQLMRLFRTIVTTLLLILFIRSNQNHEYKFFWQKMELFENY